MALPSIIPPWLNTTPQDFARSAQGGLQSGLQAAQIWQHGRQESARLAEAQRIANMKAGIEQQQNDREHILKQQKLMADQEYNYAKLQEARDRTDAITENAGQRAQAAAAHYQQMQAAGEQRAKAENLRLDVERQRLANAQNKKPAGDDWAALLGSKAGPKEPGLFSRAGNWVADLFKGAPAGGAPAATQGSPAKLKATRATALSAMHPDWSKDQIMKAVNDEFSQDASGL